MGVLNIAKGVGMTLLEAMIAFNGDDTINAREILKGNGIIEIAVSWVRDELNFLSREQFERRYSNALGQSVTTLIRHLKPWSKDFIRIKQEGNHEEM